MIVYSKRKLPVLQGIGPLVRAHFNYEEILIEDEPHWKCEEIILDRNLIGPSVPFDLSLEEIVEDPIYE